LFNNFKNIGCLRYAKKVHQNIVTVSLNKKKI